MYHAEEPLHTSTRVERRRFAQVVAALQGTKFEKYLTMDGSVIPEDMTKIMNDDEVGRR